MVVCLSFVCAFVGFFVYSLVSMFFPCDCSFVCLLRPCVWYVSLYVFVRLLVTYVSFFLYLYSCVWNGCVCSYQFDPLYVSMFCLRVCMFRFVCLFVELLFFLLRLVECAFVCWLRVFVVL